MVATIAASLVGCFGSGGSSAPAPTNVAVAAKDSRVVVTWDSVPGVTYWIFTAAGAGVTPTNCSSMPSCGTTLYATSPQVVSSLPGTYGTYGTVPLTNGVQYSFTVNGRINGGPGGPGSPAIQATPRLAGATWSTGLNAGTSDLRGVAYGGAFVATGLGGASFSSADGNIWTALSNPYTTDFYAVTFNGAVYLSVGAGGNVVALSPGTSSWAIQNSGTLNTLYAVANGNGLVVAVGASGTIITTSNSGLNWTTQSSTGNTLYGVAYGVAKGIGTYVAVGASGTLRYSTDGVTWQNAANSPVPTIDLKSVVFGGLDANGYGVFVAVGNGGTVLTSEDGITWARQTSTNILPGSNLNSVTYTAYRRFMAVGADGNIYYSEYYNPGTVTGNGGVVWTQVSPQVTTRSINAITTGGLYDYSAVGTGGLNLYAD